MASPTCAVLMPVVVCAGAASHTCCAARHSAAHGPGVWLFGERPLREATHAPLTSALDVQEQITITRQGQRVRITGGAELGSPQAAHHHATLQKLYRAVNDWFPGRGAVVGPAANLARRPPHPDRWRPALGSTALPGIWLNTGHGAGGWALACNGCARALADMLSQRAPEISVQGWKRSV